MSAPTDLITVRLCGHRGLPDLFPENSEQGLREALRRGAHAIELDVQFDQAGLPYLFHDNNTLRTTGKSAQFDQLNDTQIRQLSAHEPDRFGSLFAPTEIPSLKVVQRILQDYPKAHAFVEVKEDSFNVVSREQALHQVLNHLSEVLAQVTLISYDWAWLKLAKQTSGQPIGWVLTHYDQTSLIQAKQLQPNYLICNHTKLTFPLWPGPWQWFIYDVTEQDLARKLIQHGVTWLESWNTEQLAADLNV